jgi:predicted ATPase/DNA-binding CsgD family transcriptional regulator
VDVDGVGRSGAGASSAGNLPAVLTSLVGRQRELSELGELIAATRLLTLIGTGGSGKTRLGLAFAMTRRAEFRHGAWWVDLASVTGGDLVAGAVAAALGVPQSPGAGAAEAMVRHLRERDALVVMDNCEQVVAGCAEFLDRLLRSCPRLTVVATSREILGVPGEAVFRVDGLRLPEHDGDESAESVSLFAQRARAMSPDFAIGPGEVAAIARLCRKLDGLPLAIELAAARAGILGAAEIERRLRQDPGELLPGGLLRNPSRTAPARHQTLQATLDWSYRLLAPEEQALFRRLSAFSGSFTLAAAEDVCAGDAWSGHVAGGGTGDGTGGEADGGTRGEVGGEAGHNVIGLIRAGDVAGLLASLAGKSLALVATRGPTYRYRLLETIRQYGERELADSGEEGPTRAAHAAFYTRLAEQAQAGLAGEDQRHWLDQLEAEHDNLRIVLQRALADDGTDSGDPVAGARLAGLLWPFWYRRGYYHEARSWLEKAVTLAASEPDGTPVLAGALSGAGALAFLQCDYTIAAERLGKARALYEEREDGTGLARTVARLGAIAREEGRYADARKLYEESLAIWAGLGDAAGVARAQDGLAFTAWLSGDAARALELSGTALAYFRAAGQRHDTSSALLNQGVATYLSGDAERAASLLRESLDIAVRLGYQEMIAWARHALAVVIADDDPVAAAGMLADSLETHASLGDRWSVAWVVETIAELVARSPDAAGPGSVEPSAVESGIAGSGTVLAATLLGGAARLRRVLGTPVPSAERVARDRSTRAIRESLGAAGFRAAWQRGESLPLEDLASLASRAARDCGMRFGAVGDLGRAVAQYGLTERELAVLRLLRRGLTNREIGQELLISTGTVGVHVSNILRKLGMTSRVQVAGMARHLDL